MIYLEHCLRQARVPPPRAVRIMKTSDEPWAFPDLRDELLDLFPEADVKEARLDDGAASGADLVVLPLVDGGDFPGQDVAYRALPLLRAAARVLHASRGHVLVWRARWRQGEAVPAAQLRAYAARLAWERRLTARLARASFLRTLLEPRR